MALECIFHINGLLLNVAIAHFDAPSSPPDNHQEGSVFNYIKRIEKSQLCQNDLVNYRTCDLEVNAQARDILSNYLEYLASHRFQTSKNRPKTPKKVFLLERGGGQGGHWRRLGEPQPPQTEARGGLRRPSLPKYLL